MRLGAGPAAALLIAACVLGSAPSAARQARFRSGVQTVSIYATVGDGAGRLPTNLTRDDFRVRDNGRAVDLTVFSSDIQPITVAVMLDMSGSMAPRFLRVRTSTLHFIEALLPHDRATIGTFGSEVFVSPLLTGDKAVLKRVIQEELWPGGGTPLWAAIAEAMAEITGGVLHRVGARIPAETLATVFAELRETYTLGFRGVADGRVHRIAVRMKRSGFGVRARLRRTGLLTRRLDTAPTVQLQSVT